MSKYNIEVVSNNGLLLGEGPHWCPKQSKLYLVDIFDNLAGLLDVKTGNVETLYKTDSAVSAVVPVEGVEDTILVSTNKDVLMVNTKTGEAKRIDGIDASKVRFNDAKCDSRGRFWVGSMGLELAPGVVQPDDGALYKLGDDGKLVLMMDKVSLSNGMCWSHDDKIMYYIDSAKRVIYAMDFDAENGTISNRRVLADCSTAEGVPDGMTIDVDGNLWVAFFLGGRIVHVNSQTGKFMDEIKMPTDLMTSVCFGGPDLTQMYATSCKKMLSDEKQAAQPDAGKVFRITAPTNDSFRGFKPNYNFKKL